MLPQAETFIQMFMSSRTPTLPNTHTPCPDQIPPSHKTTSDKHGSYVNKFSAGRSPFIGDDRGWITGVISYNTALG